MSGFEYLFTFYGLLLGLAVANVATGFADMWRSRDDISPGWTTPMLGMFILLAAAHQWVSFWAAREGITMAPSTLLISMAVAFPYIFVSTGMFPRQHDKWRSLEDYYAAHSRVLMGALALPSVVSTTYNVVRFGPSDGLEWLWLVPRIGIPAVLMLTRRPLLHRIGLSLLCVLMLSKIFVDYS
ncbi:MAG: hypothetical protein EON59_11680 [Alphaproteobacteria bacterium]|nr:MAG: hypothetical protein EON59_11680 [Alphaproteobacteria bacterium]